MIHYLSISLSFRDADDAEIHVRISETKADVRHATKLSNFVAQLSCATKLPV